MASQGKTEQEALSNLKEALEFHFEPPRATRPLAVRTVGVAVGAGDPCRQFTQHSEPGATLDETYLMDLEPNEVFLRQRLM